jgi:hypothetical protein
VGVHHRRASCEEYHACTLGEIRLGKFLELNHGKNGRRLCPKIGNKRGVDS